jgi:trk system potassium uptake protein TrkA
MNRNKPTDPVLVVGLGRFGGAVAETLVDMGPLTRAHGKLLARIGATEVIYPEHDMGERVAHMVTGRMLEYVELDESFAVVSRLAPRTLVGRALYEAHVRSRYGVTSEAFARMA